jgi:hypothetical protein
MDSSIPNDVMSTTGNWRGPNIVKDSLEWYIDAGSRNSYYNGVSGTSLKDISGKGNNASLVNGASYNTSGSGCILLDGVDDYINSTQAITIPSSSQALTFSTWISFTQAGTFQSILGDGAQSATLGYIWLVVIPNTGTIRLGYSDSTNVVNANIGDPFTGYNNTFINVTVTVNYINKIAIIYRNGSQLGSTTTLTGTPLFPRNLVKYLGSYGGGVSYPLNSKISQTLLYSRALTSTEVLQNYNSTKARFGL